MKKPNSVETSTAVLVALVEKLETPKTNQELYSLATMARAELEDAKKLNADKLVKAWEDMSAELDKAYRLSNIGLIH